MEKLTPSFLDYYVSIIKHPSKTFEDLFRDKQRIRFGFYAVLIPVCVYTLVYLFLILGGGEPFKPWLAIPPEVYYRYNVFFLAPSLIFGWILASGVVQLLSRLFSGSGTFEATSAGLGFGIGLASWTTGFHDLITSFLGAVHIISQHNYEVALNSPTIWRTILWIQFALYLFCFILLFTIGIKCAHKIKTGPAIFLAFTGFICYQLFFLIFNR
jgi:hypothetical protein